MFPCRSTHWKAVWRASISGVARSATSVQPSRFWSIADGEPGPIERPDSHRRGETGPGLPRRNWTRIASGSSTGRMTMLVTAGCLTIEISRTVEMNCSSSPRSKLENGLQKVNFRMKSLLRRLVAIASPFEIYSQATSRIVASQEEVPTPAARNE